MTDMTNEERRLTVERLRSVGFSPTMALDHMTQDVRVFHLLFGHPAPQRPQMQATDLVERRAKWIRSEVVELEEATTLDEQADAYLDIIYFAVGGLVELGIKFTARLWRRVQRANIEKVQEDGSIALNTLGKVMKPMGWIAPDADIAAMIQEEATGTAVDAATQDEAINVVGDEVVQRLSLSMGGHTRILLFAIGEDGFVGSTSNMLIDDQRDFLRYINQAYGAGDVTLVDVRERPALHIAPGTETPQ